MSEKSKLFARYKSGRTEALSALLDQERECFFDYLMRMTGQISRSADSIDEIYQALLEADGTPVEEWPEFRALFYQTGRKFNADIWNANTERLENSALDDLKGQAKQEATALDLALRRLPGAEREVIVLNVICDFSVDHTARVMGQTSESVDNLILKALSRIDADCSGVVQQPEIKLKNLDRHPTPVRSMMATVDLGETVGGMRGQSLASPIRMLVLAALVGLGIWIFTHPGWLESLLNHQQEISDEERMELDN